MIRGHVFKQDAERRGGASGTEKKKIILEGFGFLYPPPPKSYFLTLQSISVPRTLPPHHFSNPFRRFPKGNGGNKGFHFL